MNATAAPLTTRIRRTGGSRSVTIPKPLADEAGFEVDAEVEFHRSDEGIFITLKRPRRGRRARRPIKELLKQGGQPRLEEEFMDNKPVEGELI